MDIWSKLAAADGQTERAIATLMEQYRKFATAAEPYDEVGAVVVSRLPSALSVFYCYEAIRLRKRELYREANPWAASAGDERFRRFVRALERGVRTRSPAETSALLHSLEALADARGGRRSAPRAAPRPPWLRSGCRIRGPHDGRLSGSLHTRKSPSPIG